VFRGSESGGVNISKSQITNPKLQTNSNDQNSKSPYIPKYWILEFEIYLIFGALYL
jgi:hypothetical protein